MKSVAVSELSPGLAILLRWIEEGETVELTNAGQVVAHVTPAQLAEEKKPDRARAFRMPDFEAMQREIYGDDLESRMLTPEDSAFIRDRGEY